MFLGIESGSPSIQKKINKNLKLDQVSPTIKLLKEHNILSTCSFIYGFPGETKEDLSQTLSLISQLISIGVYYIQIHRLTILRGTEFYEQYKGNLNIIGRATNITSGGYGKEFEEFIAKYPSIFPHFFKIDGAKYSNIHVENFINYFLKMLTKNYPFTYQIIFDRYHGDLYYLYQDMIECSKEMESPIYQILNNNIENESFRSILIDTIKRHFFESRWAEDHFMNEMFRFESDYLSWIKNPDCKFIKEYEYDIYAFACGKNVMNPQPHKTRICLSFQNNRAFLERIT